MAWRAGRCQRCADFAAYDAGLADSADYCRAGAAVNHRRRPFKVRADYIREAFYGLTLAVYYLPSVIKVKFHFMFAFSETSPVPLGRSGPVPEALLVNISNRAISIAEIPLTVKIYRGTGHATAYILTTLALSL
jgi:hypothetical protein